MASLVTQRILQIAFTSALALSQSPLKSFAADPPPNFLKLGMAEYAAGNYSDASGHLGGALSTDFNNAVLHYYLGSCYVHLKQKDAAIREFRIAYALEPEKEVGQYSKQALASYGLDSAGATDTKKTADKLAPGLPGQPGTLPGQTATSAPPFHAITPLEKQAEAEKNLREQQSRLSSADTKAQGDRLVQRTTNDLLDSMKYTTRRGTLVQPTTLSPDQNTQIEYLKRLYEAQRNGVLQNGVRQSSEIQRTADNLRDLMNEQSKAGAVHLSPSGTNLYIRNYEVTPPGPTPSTKSSTTPIVPNR